MLHIFIIVSMTYSSLLLAGESIKYLKGTVVSYDENVLQFVQGSKRYFINNKILKYKEPVPTCNQELSFEESLILKVEMVNKNQKFACKKSKEKKVAR